MRHQLNSTPFTRRDWKRRFDLFDSISLWTLVLAGGVAIVYGGVVLFWYTAQFLQLFVAALVLAVACLLGRAWARRGHLDSAIYLLLFTLLLVMSVASLMVEGIVPIAATFYAAVIVTAGIVINFRAAFVFALLAGALYVAISIVSYRLLVPALALGPTETIVLTSFISFLTFLFVGYLGWLTTRDLRRALQDATYEMVKANEELQEANRLKTHFLARVSHELRTPLNAIIGYTDMNLVGYYGELNDAQRDALGRVKSNGRQLLCLINDVLDLSRIEAEELELQCAALKPRDLVHSIIATVEPRARERGLALSSEVANDVPETVLGDEVRLKQVVLNLVDNAIKFTRQGGVQVTAEVGRDSTWMLHVRDTGRGISEREIPCIFEEFRQGDGAREQQTGGAGLGLAIARGLVEAMGGTISVKSRLGVGSTFTVALPLAPVPQTEGVTEP